MSLILQNVAGTAPFGTEFPGTVQGLLDLIAQYLEITGGQDFIAINFGPNTPGTDDRGSPWFKTDGSGNPLGWYSWNGAAWSVMPVNIPNGTTAQRPVSPNLGQLFLDTTIQCMLMYSGSEWVTQDGSPGTIKEVKTNDLETALTYNPGWIHDEDTMGRVIIGAGEGAGLTPYVYGDNGGLETVTLSIDQIPEHQHVAYGINNARWKADGNATDAAGNLAGWGSNLTSSNPPTGEGGLSHENRQPYFAYWRLVKDFW